MWWPSGVPMATTEIAFNRMCTVHINRDGGLAMVSQHPGSQSTRRSLLRTSLAATAFGVLGARSLSPVAARQLASGSVGYDAALKETGGMKAVFQSPAIDARLVAGQEVNHLLLVQLKTWLNSFQFAYELDPAELHT